MQKGVFKMTKILKNRKDVEQSLTWDLSAIYATEEQYDLAVKELQQLTLQVEKDYKGKLNSASNINECLDKVREIEQLLYLTGSYAELAVSVDHTNDENQDRFMEFMNISSDIGSRISFVDSEIIQADEKIIEDSISKSKENSNYLEDIKRNKAHALHPEVERVLAALSGTLDAPYGIYERAKLTDMNFSNFTVDEWSIHLALDFLKMNGNTKRIH